MSLSSGLTLLGLRPSAAWVEQCALQAKLAALRNDTRDSGWLDPLAGRSRAPTDGFTACRRNNNVRSLLKPLLEFKPEKIELGTHTLKYIRLHRVSRARVKTSVYEA